MNTVKVIEVIGSSDQSWEEAAKNALKDAAKSVEGINGIEVISQTADVENNEVTRYKTALSVTFVVK